MQRPALNSGSRAFSQVVAIDAVPTNTVSQPVLPMVVLEVVAVVHPTKHPPLGPWKPLVSQ